MKQQQISKSLERLHKVAALDWNVHRAHDIKVLLASYSRSQDALTELLKLCTDSGVDFRNGVTHNCIDEGEVLASGYFDRARLALTDEIQI